MREELSTFCPPCASPSPAPCPRPLATSPAAAPPTPPGLAEMPTVVRTRTLSAIVDKAWFLWRLLRLTPLRTRRAMHVSGGSIELQSDASTRGWAHARAARCSCTVQMLC